MPDPFIGASVRDYEVVERLGAGRLYRVRHRRVGVERAMRLFDTRELADNEVEDRFEREVSALASLHHQNVVGFFDLGTLDDTTRFVIMEHLRGEPLATRLGRQGNLDFTRAAPLFAALCGGLEEVHRLGVLHRNISSASLFMASTSTGEVPKLASFGLALPGSGGAIDRLARDEIFLGKLEYASPEQVGKLDPTESLDARTDIYSLGVVLYESLTGDRPFAAATPSEVVKRKLMESADAFSTRASDAGYPKALDALVDGMIQRDRERRIARVADVRSELEAMAGLDEQADLSGMATGEYDTRPAGTGLPDVGTHVGEYTLEGVIGEGGMGTVYRARHELLDVVRAVKVIKAEWMTKPSARERFLREARILAQLEHPNLVRVHACGSLDNGGYYLVQEYLEGESLRDQLEHEGHLEPSQAARLIAAAARGLDAAHRKGVVHRDVSPDNVMLLETDDSAESVRVIDFGLAKAAMDEGAATLTRSGVFMGKLAYCSPEQAGRLGQGQTIDGRSDIYSLGVVLYQALTGRLPFESPSPMGYIAKHLATPPPSPSTIGINLPAHLERLLLAMLAKDRAKRPQTMAEVASALEAISIRSDHPLTQGEAAWAGQGRHWVGPSLLLALLFALNYLETSADAWIRRTAGLGAEHAYGIASAFHWLEGHLSFEHHEAAGALAVYGYSIAYFFIFPGLGLAIALALARRSDPMPYRVFSVALAIAYLLSLPFFMFYPVPERWAHPESEAILLSDLWSSSLIETMRPISGLDNSFPSFHVSMTTVMVAMAYLTRLRLRTSVLALGLMIGASTVALGIHWLADIAAGTAVGLVAVALAYRLAGSTGRLDLSRRSCACE